jgi:hypothetical protein
VDVRPPPKNPLSDGARSWFRAHGLFDVVFWGVAAGAVGGVASFVEASLLPWALAGFACVVALTALFHVGVRPAYLTRSWRYEITAHEVYLQRGVFVITRTVVPLLRIENVDTAQGPIARRFGVMSVSVSTAAGTHEIPALDAPVAEALRDRIARLAREARDV